MTPKTAPAKRRSAATATDLDATIRHRMQHLMLAELDVLGTLPDTLPIDAITGKPDTRAEKRAAHSLDVIKALLPYCVSKIGTKAADTHDDEPPCDASLDID